MHPVAAAQWFYALRDSWTDEGNAVAGLLGIEEQTPARAVEVARGVLTADPLAVVVVGPDFLEPVRAGLAAEGLADRVLSW